MKQALNDILAIDHPVLQAPMAGGITTPDFVAQISDFGMLGSIASGYMTIEQVSSFIDQVQALTTAPVSFNLFVDYDDYGQDSFVKPQEIVQIETGLGLAEDHSFTIPPPPTMGDLIALLIDRKVSIVSTTFGLLKDDDVIALKQAGIILMTTVNSVSEADIAIQTQDSDILIFQNADAGGHKGGFSEDSHSDISVFSSAMQRYPDRHFVMAGGIVTRDDIRQALKMGFAGVQIGTGFLATSESAASQIYKQSIIDATDQDHTMFTTSITGKSARGLKNTLAQLALKHNPRFPHMHYATAALRKHAKALGNSEYQSLWAGTGVTRINQLPDLYDYMKSLIE
jgi:nitronate monooxygenase